MGFDKPVHASGYDSIPGQVPGKSLPLNARPRLSPEVERLLTSSPPGVSLDRMTDRPILRVQDAVTGLGLTKALESALSLSIQKEVMKATNQLTFQKAINATMLESGLPPDLQSVINSRAKRLYMHQLQKSGVREIYTLAELSELKKSASRPALPLKPSMALKKDPGDTKADKEAQDAANKEMGVQKGAFTIERNAANPEKLKTHAERARSRKLMKDMLPGGAADKKAPSDFDPESLKAGIQHEMEHTKDPRIAREIAMDHLTEDSGYYKIQKAKFEETGGKFVAKVKKDGRVKYYYDEDKYKKEHGEHVTGEQARNNHIHKQVHVRAHEAGEHGIDVTAFKDLVQKFGSKPIHDAVKNHVGKGVLKFTKGRFFSAQDPDGEKKKEVKKSLFTIRSTR